MLRLLGVLNGQAKGVYLFHQKLKTKVIFSSKVHYVVAEIFD